MPRKSKLTDKQWEQIGKRYIAGEKGCALAREFGVTEGGIRKKFSTKRVQIKTVGNQLFEAEKALKALPISTQIDVRTFADDLHAINLHMASAGKFNSATAHRLAGIAHGQVKNIDKDNPMETQEVLQCISAMVKMSNESSFIPLGLIKANAEQISNALIDKTTLPKELPSSVDDFI